MNAKRNVIARAELRGHFADRYYLDSVIGRLFRN
jgi:hypothetical protein